MTTGGTGTDLRPARLSARDRFEVASSGMVGRPVRVVLSALGIALGIAALVAVVGLSASSKQAINNQLDALGTNLLTVTAGQSIFGQDSQLPVPAEAMIARVGPVTEVSAAGATPVSVYRNVHIDPLETNGISVQAARSDLLDVLRGSMAAGSWLNDATAAQPIVVLGSTAAQRLGLDATDVAASVQVTVGDDQFTLGGIMAPNPLVDTLDSAALVGWPIAEETLGFDGHATAIYTRATDAQVQNVADVLAATANPQNPQEVDVSRPSDVLAAKAATDSTLTSLLLGLGAVSLLVGGVGVANTMVIAVLERRQEIGLRRALGATRRAILGQFVSESALLALLGGLAGVLLGSLVVVLYALAQGWPIAVPLWAVGAGLGCAVVVGALAGLFPATRAARLDPAAALTPQ